MHHHKMVMNYLPTQSPLRGNAGVTRKPEYGSNRPASHEMLFPREVNQTKLRTVLGNVGLDLGRCRATKVLS